MFVDGQVRQLKKDARHNCYTYIPVSLGYRANEASRRRLAMMLLTSFSGGDGLHVLLCAFCLAIFRLRRPDILLIFYGFGMDGKTLILVNLLSAALGSGFSNPSSTILQVERELQQQAQSLTQSLWATIDERRRDHGIVEDMAKLLIGGGQVPCRRNHEAETRYVSLVPWSL